MVQIESVAREPGEGLPGRCVVWRGLASRMARRFCQKWKPMVAVTVRGET